jgi:hypothetical protein
VLPYCSEETLEQLERNLSGLPSLTQMLNSGMTPQDITDTILADIGAIEEVRGAGGVIPGSWGRGHALVLPGWCCLAGAAWLVLVLPGWCWCCLAGAGAAWLVLPAWCCLPGAACWGLASKAAAV